MKPSEIASLSNLGSKTIKNVQSNITERAKSPVDE